MNPLVTLRLALRALRRNKMRSFLTTLGIVIGVASVIAMVAIGEGAKAKQAEIFAAMGSNLLILMPGSTSMGGVHGGAGSQPTLTWEDLKAINDPTQAPAVKEAAPVLRVGASVLAEDANWTTSVQGTTPAYFDIRNWPTAQGSAMTSSDVESAAKLAWLGQTVVDKLYGPSTNPVGQIIRINNIPFSVAGVLAKKGQSPMGQDYDDAVLVPLSTFRQKLRGDLGNYINGIVFIGATSSAGTVRAEAQVRSLLRDRHRIGEGQEDDFFIRNLTEMANAQQEGTRTFTTLLAAVAAVSLLVGGIGIMNIMLVSVTERTREIGVRMAVGAKGRNIRAQFLVEALTLAVIGGLIGVALGLGTATYLARSFGWQLLVRPDIIVIAVGFSAAVGVGFGLYPAHKASRLDPIDALRYE